MTSEAATPDIRVALDDLVEKMNRCGVPSHLRRNLASYIISGRTPGPFLTAVLSNNLLGAFRCADDDSRAGLFDLVSFLYNEVPAPAWGSPEKVEKWKGMR